MMRPLLAAVLVAGTLGGTLAAGHAYAEEGGRACNAPMAQWQPKSALKQMLKHAGYQVRSITTEGGCYEAYAIDKHGHRRKLAFNPKTLRVVARRDNDAQ